MDFDYQKFVEARQPQFEDDGIRCLCCRDTGRLPDLALKRYLSEAMPRLVAMYEHPLLATSAPVVECTRQGCNAGMVKVEVSTKQRDGEGGFEESTTTKRVRRFSWGTDTLSPSFCQWIHEQEWERIQNLEPRPPVSPVRIRAAIAAGLMEELPDMPKAQGTEEVLSA